MSATLTTPDIRRTLADLGRRLGILERRITGTASSASSPANDDIIFSYSGTLAATESPPAKLRYGGFLASISIGLGTTGSTDTTIDVKQNASVIATITVPSSSADVVADIGARVDAEDRISLEITSAGTGAADMTAAARFT